MKIPTTHCPLPTRRHGFTLVELLIYSVIFAGVSLTLVYFLSTFFRVSGYQASSSEVANQANFILGKIQNEITTSSLVVVNDTGDDELDDTVGAPHSKLLLKTRNETTGDASDDESPVLIYKNDGNVVLKRGNSPETVLNNASVAVTNLAFTKVSTPPGKDVVLIDLTLQYQSPNTYDRISRDFTLGVSRAQAASFDSNVSPNQDNSFSLGEINKRWGSLFLSGGATIDGKLSLTNGNTNTTNNSITFLKQGIIPVNPGVSIGASAQATIILSAPELAGIQTGDRVFMTPPSDITSPLEDGLLFMSASAFPNGIRVVIKNIKTSSVSTATHNWGYLVIR
jgi:type II secretory pathway pseudopilin PulG